MQIIVDKHYLLNNFQDLRILQINILFIHGLSDEACTNMHQMISNDFGPVFKITYQKLHNNFNSAFVTFMAQIHASKALLALNNSCIDHKRILRVYYGSTKFCPNFLRDQACHIQNCNYAHYYIPWLSFFKKDLKSIDHSQIAKFIIEQDNQKYNKVIENTLMNYSNTQQIITQEQSHEKKCQNKTISQKSQHTNYRKANKSMKNVDIHGQQIDWLDINKQIDGYVQKQKQLKMQKRTKIQQFLDDAEKKLFQLIFKYKYL